jgi:hypothetical protein
MKRHFDMRVHALGRSEHAAQQPVPADGPLRGPRLKRNVRLKLIRQQACSGGL